MQDNKDKLTSILETIESTEKHLGRLICEVQQLTYANKSIFKTISYALKDISNEALLLENSMLQDIIEYCSKKETHIFPKRIMDDFHTNKSVVKSIRDRLVLKQIISHQGGEGNRNYIYHHYVPQVFEK